MPIQELYANSTLIVLAGSESTASGLAGITFHLLKSPESLKKARDEVRGAFTTEDDIGPERVKRLPYLAAIVSEGLRMYPPFPEGLPRLAPRQGANISGQFVPGGVCSAILQSSSWLTDRSRPMCNSAPTWLIAAPPISKMQTRLFLNVGSATRNSRPTTKKSPNLSPSGHAAVLAGSECEPSCQLSVYNLHDHALFPLFSPLHVWEKIITDRRNSLAYLEMRLILARMLWSFDLQLDAESEHWDEQDSWIQWDKKPLLVKLRPSEKQG